MHKSIRNIIALTLVIGTVSCIGTSNDFMFGSIKAYASTYRSATDGELSSLIITRSTGSEIKLLDSYYGDEITLSSEKDYYLELTGADGFQISADVKGSGYVVKQFTSDDKTEKGEDVGGYINIDSNTEDVYLRTYKSEDDYKDAYDDGDVTNCEHTYIIHVKKAGVIPSDEELDKEYANLKDIYLSDGTIDFSEDQYSYNVNVDDKVEEILVRATPKNDDDVVEINGESVEENDNFEKTISLNEGNNTITIDVEGDEDNETYTLNVYRGKSSNVTQTNTNATVNGGSVGKYNSWQQVNGKWQYLDGTGDALKSQWWFDANTGKKYYLDKDGYAVTGWLYVDNNWYYFASDGEMKTGWLYLDGSWYYLNKSGVMRTGWFQDTNGTWYYLDSTGKLTQS
ncbi:cell wall binding repeat-containing protein [Clostridium sp. DL-VIII]|uniref:N-acetylmuramoyl-L-alanine amidase family protein n=1 Tax=Clostridium sp. DL-VIII TaxID=641107 RepID=UPI00023B0144|nr:cadherin-like beta sandwich domain-containing protein [Clostridium sp. DL-VIII]EHI98610.1 cell wall binding repeat-containing protein [Clostridium sp. DL-VIII]